MSSDRFAHPHRACRQEQEAAVRREPVPHPRTTGRLNASGRAVVYFSFRFTRRRSRSGAPVARSAAEQEPLPRHRARVTGALPSPLERTVHDDSRPLIKAGRSLLRSKPAKSGRHVSVVDDLEAESLVVRAVPGHVLVRGERQCHEAVLSCPRCRGLDERAAQTPSGSAGMDRDLLDMRAAINDVHQQVGAGSSASSVATHALPAACKADSVAIEGGSSSATAAMPSSRKTRRPLVRAPGAFPTRHLVRLGSCLRCCHRRPVGRSCARER